MRPAARAAIWVGATAVVAAGLSVLLVLLLRPEAAAPTPGPTAASPTVAPSAPVASDEPLDVGEYPSALELSPDGTRAYVTSSRGVTVLDAATRETIGVIGAETTPRAMAMAPDGLRAFLPANQTLVVLDLTTNLLSDTIALPESYNYISSVVGVVADGRQVLIVAGAERSPLLRVDLAAGTAEQIVEVGSNAQVLLSPDGATAWLPASYGANATVQAVDVASGVVTSVPGTEDVTELALSPDEGGPVIGFTFNERLTIDAGTRTVARKTTWDGSAGLTVIAPGGSRAYAVGSSDGVVTVFDPATDDVIDTGVGGLRTGGVPADVALSPDGNTLWVVGDNGVTAVDVSPYR